MPRLIAARLLGSPEVTVDGEPPPADLLWRKHMALCLALWCAPERRRSRDQLIGLLWADKDDKAARHSLNEALRVIRRAAGDDALDTGTSGVRWTGDVDLDLDRFAAIESTDPDNACTLIAGQFCDGFVVPGAGDFDQWLEEERRRWQRRIVSVLVRAASLAEDRGHIHQSVALAERALALDPYADLAVQAVMRGYWLGGDRASALTAGEAFRTRLERDLGVVPDETTAATMARISRERGPRRPPQAEAPAQRVPLIGREAELQALLDTWRAAADAKRPALLMVNGSGGSGRSRLIEEIISRATIAGATTIALHAVEVDARDEHAVVLGLAASGLHLAPGIAAAPSSALSAFAARLMEWADRFRAPSNVKPLPLRDAFTAVVRATAEERPIVLAIDDADRVHPDELRWFAALMRALTGVPVTLLLSVCTGPGHPGTDELLSDVGREIPGTIVTLDAFEMPELERLVGVVLHAWPADARDRLARRLMAESAGAPAIAVDVLHAVQHGLSLDTATHWPQPGRTLDATLPGPFPESLIAAIRLAFRRLHPDEQAMLSAAALLDEPFSAARVGKVAGITDAAALDARLDALEWERWITADGRGYAFPARAKRRLIAEEMLTPGQRRRLRERIADPG